MRPNFVFEEPYIRRFPGADFHFLCVDIDDLDLHVDDDNRLVKPLVVLQSWPNIPTGRLYVNYSIYYVLYFYLLILPKAKWQS